MTNSEVIAPTGNAPTGVGRPENWRAKSVRSYRRVLDRVIAEVYAGVRPSTDLNAFANATKAASELLLAEKMLHKAGQDIEPPASECVHGDAGTDTALPAPGTHSKRKVLIKDGVNKYGHPCGEESVTTTSGKAEPIGRGDDPKAITDGRAALDDQDGEGEAIRW